MKPFEFVLLAAMLGSLGFFLGTRVSEAMTSPDERVYREFVNACDTTGWPLTDCHPGHRCGPELLAWEHAVSPGNEELNCLYSGGTAKSCHVKCQ